MLRVATENDLDHMRTWRNQLANREVSLHQDEIAREEHIAWWSKIKSDPHRRVLMAQVSDRTVGVVTYFDIDQDNRTASWGFYLDNEGLTAQGLVMSAWVLVMREAVNYAFDVLDVDTLTGEVLEHNEAVRMMNRRSGFVEGAPETREIDGRQITSIPISLSRANRRVRKPRRAQA